MHLLQAYNLRVNELDATHTVVLSLRTVITILAVLPIRVSIDH